ncbi:MAG TPA: hypothetical protein PK156_42075, partial [Polyangium sp.]|nr:hypothetical protein [Polyangium sp.]
MNRPPSNPPPPNSAQPPADQPPKPMDASVATTRGLGLSNAQAKVVRDSMLGMIFKVGCPGHLHRDALN